jgi:hypothetical protein
MIPKIFIVVFYAVAGTAAATTQLIDNVPASNLTGVNHPPGFYYTTFQSSINDTQFGGQNVTLNLSFDNFFIRAFTATPKVHPQPLLFDLYLSYNPRWPDILPPEGSPSVSGTATLLGETGQSLGATALNVALDGGPTFGPDVQMWFAPNFAALPSDIYGIRYDLKLSDSNGKSFGVSDPYPFDQLAIYGLFGVGPGRLPTDIVPDSDSTIALLALGLLLVLKFGRLIGS